jgi:Arc/MetJ family transcription regulator
MRSTIDINEELIEEAKALTGAKTKKEVIDFSLRELIRRSRREHLASLFGSGVLNIGPDEIEKNREDGC